MSGFLLLLFELIGTVAFASSGTITALEKRMDIFGVIILGLTTAVGGGVIRDISLGITPPATFTNPIYALTSIAVSILLFIPAVRAWLRKGSRLYEPLMLVMDSLGLGVFTVVGIQCAHMAQPDGGIFLQLFVGVVTGIGGGILRDIMAGNTPYVFVKHFYASASLAGALVCIFLWNLTGELLAMSAGAGLIFILRLLAARFHWKLPRAL